MGYTLDETFTYCESMWIWITAQIEDGSEYNINQLKAQWLSKHGFIGVITDCFFCDYAYIANGNTPGRDMCDIHCPGKMADPDFTCTHPDYSYDDKPIQFKNKILGLSKLLLS